MSSDPRPHCACGRPYDPHPDDDTEECWVCRSDADERAALGFGPDDDDDYAALDCEDGICGGSGVCPDCDEGQANHGLTCGTCLGTGDCPGCVACGDDDRDERENEDRPPTSPNRVAGPTLPDGPVAERAALVYDEQASASSSPEAGTAALPAGSVPAGQSGSAALGEGLRSGLITEAAQLLWLEYQSERSGHPRGQEDLSRAIRLRDIADEAGRLSVAAMTPDRARALLEGAESHLHGCEIMAVRRPDARADWTPVRDLAQAAPDLARAYLASEGRLAFLAEVGGASGWCDLHPRRVEANTAGMIGRDTTDGADVCLACEVRRLEAERDALRTHGARLREALDLLLHVIPVGWDSAVGGGRLVIPQARAALAATPVAPPEAHDRRVRAEALREAATAESMSPTFAAWLRERAGAIERGEP